MSVLPEKFRHIAVEGPIGAGKTTLAKRIAERTHAHLLLEEPDVNPFLPRFYQDHTRYALSTQLFFLFQRVQQMDDLQQDDMFKRATISDFLLEKDPLFARLTLNDDEFGLYQQIYTHLKPRAAAPDLVIYLQAAPETLIARVRKRGIQYERGISEEYLTNLAESYARFFYQYDASPVLIVNSERLNFADAPADFELLLERIRDMRSGREFFNLGE